MRTFGRLGGAAPPAYRIYQTMHDAWGVDALTVSCVDIAGGGNAKLALLRRDVGDPSGSRSSGIV